MHGAGVTLGDAEIIERLTSEVCDDLAGGITWRPGVVALVTALADAGIPQAIVTTSARTMAAIVAAQLPTDAIHVIVSGDDVSHGKPHPEPYLQAARLLNVDAARCIAVEDSPTGLASAVAAGTVAIAVPHDAVIPAGAGWTVLDTLEGVGPGELGALLGTQPADSGSGPVR
jgi:beta-phosphoglucomutase-like phosphatase (HAD superfamily)